MKRLLIPALCLVASGAYTQNNNPSQNSQGNTHWKTDGNLIDSNRFIGTVNDRPLVFKSNNSERFRLTPEGNVGIGTSTPQTLLDVNGNVTLRNDLWMPGLPFALSNDNVLLIDATGQVRRGDSDLLKDLLYQDKGCTPAVIQAPTWSNGPGKIYVNCPDVNVGINTDNPLYRLDVRGNSHLDGAVGIGVEPVLPNIQLNLKTQANRGVGICIDHQVYDQFSYGYKILVHDETTKGFAIYSKLYEKEVFTMRADGQLIISNNQQKILQLEPDGLLRSRHIKVDLDNWADYVFDEGYELMPLEEVEAYIAEEGHLPKVPSADEMIENGLDVEETNRMLMEKVEELTLYLIEQNKELTALKEEITKLKTEKP